MKGTDLTTNSGPVKERSSNKNCLGTTCQKFENIASRLNPAICQHRQSVPRSIGSVLRRSQRHQA